MNDLRPYADGVRHIGGGGHQRLTWITEAWDALIASEQAGIEPGVYGRAPALYRAPLVDVVAQLDDLRSAGSFDRPESEARQQRAPSSALPFSTKMIGTDASTWSARSDGSSGSPKCPGVR
jgi:hypothetical protein